MFFRFFFLLACTGVPLSAYPQKHDHTWILGAYNLYAMDFNDYPMQIKHVVNTQEYVFSAQNTAMSDAKGRLYFYSDGCDIRGWDNQVMDNGGAINKGESYEIWCGVHGGYGALQGMFALPFGGGYLLFHLRAYPVSAPSGPCIVKDLLCSYVDTSAQGGRVAWSDSLLLKGCWQTAVANRHANGRDWWVLAASNEADSFYRFLVTPHGIQGPWGQKMAHPARDPYYFDGSISFSPDGRHYLVNHWRTGFAVYGFDRCSGLLSPPRFVPMRTPPLGSFGAGFSPDSRFVYCTAKTDQEIWQYDCSAPDLGASGRLVAVWDGFRDTFNWPSTFGRFFVAPDGKVYVSAGVHEYWHTVEYPNRLGAACRVAQRSVYTPGYANYGTYFYYPNYRLGPIDGSPCDTLGLDNRPVALFRHDLEDTAQTLRLTFTDLSYYEPAEWSWDFGDPASGAANMSRDTNPVHVFSKPGRYRVCLTVRNAYASNVFCRDIEVGSTATEAPDASWALVSPNPADGHLFVRLKEPPAREASLVLVNALGQKVLQTTTAQQEMRLDVSALHPGLYVLRLQTPGKAPLAKSFVVLR